MATPSRSFNVPVNDPVLTDSGKLSLSWISFFRSLYDLVNPIGDEQSFQLVNNQSAAANVDGGKVDSRAVSYAIIEYLVQRVTTGTGATELVESGSFELLYRPTLDQWVLHVIHDATPDDAGVTFTVTTDGQVQYTTTNITGTASLSRVVWRARTLAAKSSLYSSQAARS